MINDQWLLRGKIVLGLLLAATTYGFFYFENSLLMQIIVLIFGLSSFLWAILYKDDAPPLNSRREILILFILYLGVYTLYNMLYGLGMPLYLIMIAVWLLVSLLFLALLILDRIDTLLNHPLFYVFVSLSGLISLEVFLSLSFWPIDPKVKSLILVVVFYLMTNLIYLHTHNMLRFKKIIGLIIASFLIIGLLILSIWTSLKGG